MQEKEVVVYSIIDCFEEVVSTIKCCYYGIDFNWILICDAWTKFEYRKKGMMRFLMKVAYNYAIENGCGTYLLVSVDNFIAIKAYRRIGFKMIRTVNIYEDKYFVMAIGKNRIDQLLKMNFQ